MSERAGSTVVEAEGSHAIYVSKPDLVAVLQGVVIPGNDGRISDKIATRLGGRELQIRGDVRSVQLLDRLSVEELLEMMEPGSTTEPPHETRHE
jgi:hypothetical protein